MADTEKRFKKIYLEISNICNLKCSFCPAVEREQQALNREKFTTYLTQVAPLAERVCLHVMGEPLNHPALADFIAIAESLQVKLELTTNGTLLSPKIYAALLNPTVVQINFSLQSFMDNFPQANPKAYIQQIFVFCDTAIEKRPDLYINFRLWNLTEVDLPAANEYFLRTIEDKYQLSIKRSVDVSHIKSKKISGRIYLHFDSRFRWPNRRDAKISTQGSCYGTRSHIAIHADGRVVPCCLDKEAQIELGDLNRQSLGEILTSERFVQMNRGFSRGQLVEELCQRCSYISRFADKAKKLVAVQDTQQV